MMKDLENRIGRGNAEKMNGEENAIESVDISLEKVKKMLMYLSNLRNKGIMIGKKVDAK
jgi:hypothetical protein